MGSSSTGGASRSKARMEGPDPYWPGTCLGGLDSLEEANKEEGTENRITIPLVGTFFFFSIKERAGGNDVGRFSPGALRKVPSCLFSSLWLRSSW